MVTPPKGLFASRFVFASVTLTLCPSIPKTSNESCLFAFHCLLLVVRYLIFVKAMRLLSLQNDKLKICYIRSTFDAIYFCG